jgi:hypothetical protein
LQAVGLDEIRFHPVKDEYFKAIEEALKFDSDVGIEVPSLPHEKDYLDKNLRE